MAIASNLAPSEQVRLVLHERLKGKVQQVEGGPWDGVPVVTEKDVDVAFGEQLPPPSSRGAEVATPARILVSAECANCHQVQQMVVFVSTKTEIDAEHRTLKLVAKSKSMGHNCGQVPLPLPVDGQTEAFADESADADQGEDVLVSDDELGEPDPATPDAGCPFPGCALGADHNGPHALAAENDETPAASDDQPRGRRRR